MTGKFRPQPLHNWASDIADALRTGATGFVQAGEARDADLYPEVA